MNLFMGSGQWSVVSGKRGLRRRLPGPERITYCSGAPQAAPNANFGYNPTMETSLSQLEVVDDVTVELSRKKTPLELTLLASHMFCAARDRLKAYLRLEHPSWTEAQLHEELLRRIHGSA
jgi:hypothetical protein